MCVCARLGAFLHVGTDNDAFLKKYECRKVCVRVQGENIQYVSMKVIV